MKQRRILTILLSLVMLLSILPQTCVFAESLKSGDWEYKVNDDGNSVTIVKYTGSDSANDVTIPETIDGKSVTIVGDGSKAFEKAAKTITKVTFPTTVEKISDYAFLNCTCLWDNNIGDLTALKSIGAYAFCNANMGGTRFPESLESIGEQAFRNTKVVYLSFGSKLKTIGKDAFSSCMSLRTLDFSKAENLETIGEKAFCYCEGLKSVDFSGAKKLKTIGNEGFMQCESLRTVDLSKTIVETIGDEAFSGCSEEMESVTSAPAGLSSVTFPETLKTIGEEAFYVNYALTSISFPETLEYIGDCAFANCAFLKGDVNVPAKVSYLGEGAFALTGASLKLDANNKNYQYGESGALYNADKTLLLYVPRSVESFVVPDTVKRIGKYAFCEV